jgi:D-alanyl-D-alanine carboxypeptidase/D-alanyl-D-alanine-endopeptidase (penicillin-binding protein 4)
VAAGLSLGGVLIWPGGSNNPKATATILRSAASHTTSSTASTTTTVLPTTTTVATAPPTTAPPPPPPTTAPPAATAQRVVPPPPAPLSFPARIDKAFGGFNGCLVIEQDGVITYERNPTTPFVPASTQKIMVAAAALNRLGPEYRFETKVVAPTPPGPDGRLENAWMVGGGDPFLATPDYIAYAASKPRLNTLALTHLTQLADALVTAGVKDVPGGFYADESRHDTQRSVPTWKPSYVTQAEVGSLGALTVNSGLAGWGPNQRVAPDPAASATAALTRLLGERGVTVAPSGQSPDGSRTAPKDGVVVASVLSAPLSEVVAGMLRASDNYAAEMILRELDRHHGGVGSTAGGAAHVVADMAAAGVDVTGVHLNDGSGLDTGNRSTCRALVGTLALASKSGMDALVGGLAVAGRSGTLIKRFVGTIVEGRLAAKTGWINGVAGLAGRLDVPRTRNFALLLNGSFSYAASSAVQNRVVEVMAAEP